MENVLIHLSKDSVLSSLQKRVEELDSAIRQLGICLKNSPTEKLKVSPHNGTYQYYLISSETGKKGKFISKKEWNIAERIAQRDYDTKLLEQLINQRTALQTCIATYHPEIAETFWSEQHPGRQKLTQPRIISDDEYANEWQLKEFCGRPFDKTDHELKTARGERVRSKSEVIIANALDHFNVPYRYEFPHKLKITQQSIKGKYNSKRINIFPDFTCLNKKTRKEIIWEHFGLIDDSSYAQTMALKLEEYQQNGFFLGDNFIMTTETNEHPLSYETVEKLIRRYLCES